MARQHKVRQGECLNSISEQYGLFWQTVWNDPGNQGLKDRRKDPSVLLPGDMLTIPDKRVQEVDCSSDSTHRFRKKGVPAKLKIQLVIEDEPLKNQAYSLLIDDQFWSEGTTDGEGYLETTIPPRVIRGRVVIGPPDDRISFSIDFGTLDPLDSEGGALQRLHNMGYEVGEDPRSAVAAFQEDEDLSVTGELDQATRDRIEEIFGQ